MTRSENMAYSTTGIQGKSLNYQERGTNESLIPPPPIPQRNQMSNPPPMGWNIPGLPESNVSANANSMNPSTNPFQNNFTGNIAQNEVSSHKHGTISVNIPNPTSTDSTSLIALSQDHQKGVSSTTYSTDLQGISFDNSGVHEHLKQPQLSSSSENLSSKPSYPDISHVFREVRRDHHPTKSEFVGMSSNSWQTSGQVGNYGWNPEYFGQSFKNDPWTSVNDVNTNAPGPPLPPRKSLSSVSSISPIPSVQNSVPTNLQIGPGLVQVLPMYPHPVSNQSCWTGYQTRFPQQFSHMFNSQPVNSGFNGNRPASVKREEAWSTNRLYVPHTTVKRTPSNSEFDNLRGDPNQSESDVFLENFNVDFVDDIGRPQSRKGSDLIELSDEEKEDNEKEYLSLECFDPLYKKQRSESISSRDGILSGSPKDGISSFVFAESSHDFVPKRIRSESTHSSSLYPQIPDSEEENEICPMASHDELEKFLRSEVLESEPEAPPRPPPPKSQVHIYLIFILAMI